MRADELTARALSSIIKVLGKILSNFSIQIWLILKLKVPESSDSSTNFVSEDRNSMDLSSGVGVTKLRPKEQLMSKMDTAIVFGGETQLAFKSNDNETLDTSGK